MAYEKFMHNKYFHPASIQNIKKVWEAEQRQIQEQKQQEDLRQQYLKEQEIYQNKEQLGKAHPLSFMYDPPPGYDKEQGQQERLTLVSDTGQSDNVTEELKFDWQKPGRQAPREDTAGDVSELKDQPFGVEVRNIKCVKCGKWGHVNTDKICPLYGQLKEVSSEDAPTPPEGSSLEDGLVFNQCVKDRIVNSEAPNQQIIASDEDGSDLDDLLAGFSKKERKKILRKLAKMDDDGERKRKRKKKHKDSSKRSRREGHNSEDEKKLNGGHRNESRRGTQSDRKKKPTVTPSSDESSSEDSPDERTHHSLDQRRRRRSPKLSRHDHQPHPQRNTHRDSADYRTERSSQRDGSERSKVTSRPSYRQRKH